MTNDAIPRPAVIPRPTAQAEPYVEALGAETAMAFLLAFGGAELYLGASPRENTAYVQAIGPDGAAALFAVAHRLQKRVPLCDDWLSAMLHWQGQSISGIARRFRTTDVSVRKKLRRMAERDRGR